MNSKQVFPDALWLTKLFRHVKSLRIEPMADRYIIGIMKAAVNSEKEFALETTVEAAIETFKQTLSEELQISVTTFSFSGPHLTPESGAYAALDFLRLGLSEKIERNIDFLLIVTEVDLAASKLSFALALPSQLTNIAVISTKRLEPEFRVEQSLTCASPNRLAALMLYSFGRIVNLSRVQDPDNVMFDFKNVEELDTMVNFTQQQRETVVRNLPVEARERVSKHDKGQFSFILRALAINSRGIMTGIIRANPLSLVAQLPTMATAAISVLIFLFFTPDMWDVASTMEMYQLVIFSLLTNIGATLALYKTFAFGPILSRDRVVSESAVVTEAVAIASLFLTMLIVNLGFLLLVYVAIISIFPYRLMETWTTVRPATGLLAHLKLSLLIGGLALLAGSLGGRADSKDLIRAVLFTKEES